MNTVQPWCGRDYLAEHCDHINVSRRKNKGARLRNVSSAMKTFAPPMVLFIVLLQIFSRLSFYWHRLDMENNAYLVPIDSEFKMEQQCAASSMPTMCLDYWEVLFAVIAFLGALAACRPSIRRHRAVCTFCLRLCLGGAVVFLILLPAPKTAAGHHPKHHWLPGGECKLGASAFARHVFHDLHENKPISVDERLVVVAVAHTLAPGLLDRWMLAAHQLAAVGGAGGRVPPYFVGGRRA